jgi:DNA-binding LytR/AlgR family response regulator
MPEKLTYLIVDDDDLDREAVRDQASVFSFLHCIAVCSQPLESVELIKRFQPDIIFADIEMGGISGLQMAGMLGGLVPAPVFITSHPEYALESYAHHAFDFIIKPLAADRFSACVHRLYDFFELRSKAAAYDVYKSRDEILIKQGHEKHRLSVPDILYLEAMKDYTRIVTTTGQYMVLNSISRMMKQLPEGRFLRIHRSFMVNSERVSIFKGDSVQVLEFELPVSRQYRNMLRRTLR